MLTRFRQTMALVFSLIFFALSASLSVIAVHLMAQSFASDKTVAEGLLKALNMAVISLATFELGLGVHKEYASHDEADDILVVLRRTVSRFVSIVCIALVLEGLIMVIKYSQLELAGNLPYPVAILVSAAFLLLALGGFLRLSRPARPEARSERTDAIHSLLADAGWPAQPGEYGLRERN